MTRATSRRKIKVATASAPLTRNVVLGVASGAVRVSYARVSAKSLRKNR
jgi:hypothetical protein